VKRYAVTLTRHKVHRGGKTYEYWQLRWRDGTGKRRAKTLDRTDHLTEKKAQKDRALKEAELRTHPDRATPTEYPTVPEWCATVRASKEGTLAPRSLDEYDFAARLLEAHFGDLTLDRIRRDHALEFAGALQSGRLSHIKAPQKAKPGKTPKARRPMGPVTVEKYLRSVRAIFAMAASVFRGLDGNPFDVVKAQAIPASDWSRIDAETFWKLYRAAGDGWRVLLALCRMAALSRSDAAALTWAQVDFAAGVIEVRRQKTGVQCRPPICPELAEILTTDGRVFRRGESVVPAVYLGNVGRDFRRLCVKAGVDVVPGRKPLHDLRKSCIDDWARAGYSPGVVQVWAGHRNIATTMKYYSKVDRRDVERARARAFLPKSDAKPDATAHGAG